MNKYFKDLFDLLDVDINSKDNNFSGELKISYLKSHASTYELVDFMYNKQLCYSLFQNIYSNIYKDFNMHYLEINTIQKDMFDNIDKYYQCSYIKTKETKLFKIEKKIDIKEFVNLYNIRYKKYIKMKNII